MKKYPDIRALIKKKEDHRQLLAALSFEEKIELVFKLKERQKFIRSGRPIGEKRPQARRQPKGYSSIGNLTSKKHSFHLSVSNSQLSIPISPALKPTKMENER
jgi:hypothetical protein